MADFHFSVDDVERILKGLDALQKMGLPEYLNQQLRALQIRISNGFPHLSHGEMKNICLGLESLLIENPLDWKTDRLLQRLQALIDSRTPPEQ